MEEGIGSSQPTQRGFGRVEFTDIYGFKCSLQQSSLADRSAIWLGVDQNRMHLDEDGVRRLIVSLNRWLETGSF